MAAANSLRIKSNNVTIEVNDAGECITLPFDDQSFATRALALISGIDPKIKEITERVQAVENAVDIVDGMGISSKQREMIAINQELHEYFAKQIDDVFGPETCRKVFGPIVPHMELISQFFDALGPYFEKYGKERNKKMQKYNAGRRGNV